MPSTQAPPATKPPTENAVVQRRIAKAATLTAIGNISSRVVGLVAVAVRTYFFGNSQAASAFELASNIPTIFNDLLAGGMLSSALVPTFSRYTDEKSEKLHELGRLIGALITLASLVLSVVVGFLLVFEQPLAAAITFGRNQDMQLLSSLLRVSIPAILFLNLSGIVTAALFARHKFHYTAFTATAFNMMMIVCTVLFANSLGATALGVGLLAGSVVQMAMQLPGLRGIPITLNVDWRHPGIAQIAKLFLPVAGGLVLAQLAAQLSFTAANVISPEGPATMRYAAQVIQFPIGMVVVAVSSAILPTLAAQANHASLDAFKGTLAQGLRLVAFLIMPSAVGLWVLGRPIIGLLFERGAFTPESTAYTVIALQAALFGLAFEAIDKPLIFSFYALRDTRTPTLIGLAATVIYLIWIGLLALLWRAGLRQFTLFDLILANSFKTGVDALLMGIFLMRKIGGMKDFHVLPLLAKTVLASALMGVAVWLVGMGLSARVGAQGFFAHAVVSLACAVVGVVVYVGCARLLRMPELGALRNMLRR
jgi:putative peptidoglycan lipid II flippase